MKPSLRILFPCLFVCLVSQSGFSQVNSATSHNDESESSKSAGLRKIASGSGLRDMDIEVNIDEEALEASIANAVEEAMEGVESMEAMMENIEIHIEPIEINLHDLDINVDPVVINIPNIDINIEPIEIEIDDMDVDINEIDINIDDDHYDMENVNDDGDDQSFDSDKDKNKEKNKNKDKNKEKNKNKVKFDKGDKSDKVHQETDEKSKGLQKIN